MLFKLGCSAFCFPGLDLDEKLKLVSHMGFDFVDLSSKEGAELPQKTIVEQPLEYGKLIKEKAAQNRLKLDELFVCTIMHEGAEMDLTTSDAALRQLLVDKFTAHCRFAQAAGFISIMVVPLSPNEKIDEVTAWKNTVDILTEFCGISASYNLIFNIEPVDFSLLKTPEIACKMAAEVPGMGFTLDYSHYISVGFSQDEIEPMHAYTNHMHIRQAAIGSRQEPIETGIIDFRRVAQRLLNDDFSGNITMEHIDVIEPYKLCNSPVRQNAELAARIKNMAKHELVKQ